MRFGNCHFQIIANEGESAASLVTETLIKALKLQLLVVVLPEKSPFYGRSFELFHLLSLASWLNQSLLFQTGLREVSFFMTGNIN